MAINKRKVQQMSTEGEGIVSKTKSKVSTKSVVEKKAATPKPTIASLTKELEETKRTFSNLFSEVKEIVGESDFEIRELKKQLALAQRPWYIKIFDLFANK